MTIQSTDYLSRNLSMKWNALILLMITIFFEIGYCGHPAFPYACIQQEQATKFILSQFQEEDHPFIYDALGNKKKRLVCLYFVYIPKKNTSVTDITDDDQKYYEFAPTYGEMSTPFQRHMISVVLFSYSKKLQSMLVDYSVTKRG